MKLTLLSVVLLAATLHAQTAKVIELSPEDAAMAKSLHEQKEALEDKIAKFKESINKRYLLAPDLVVNKDHFHNWKPGWAPGTFEYSDDYKFIVPSSQTTGITFSTCPTWVYGGNPLTDGRSLVIAN